ncbi:MAG: GreA/GreB family elongation factor [Bacilli bacterium]|nr:GreA/GreB family elongation factor [Bacilli bacterium]
MKEILLDESGYKQFIEEMEKLKSKSDLSAISGSEAYTNAVGDGWHDNFAFEESMRESRLIAKRIDDMYDLKKHIKVIEDKNKKDDVVNLNDKVVVEIIYSDDDKEEDTLILTGKFIPSTHEITINSPIGKAIYKAKIGSTQKYNVGEKEIQVKIIKKLV